MYLEGDMTMKPLSLPGYQMGRQEDPGTQKYKNSYVLNSGDSVVKRTHEDSAYSSFVIQAKVGHTVPMLSKVLVCGQLSF